MRTYVTQQRLVFDNLGGEEEILFLEARPGGISIELADTGTEMNKEDAMQFAIKVLEQVGCNAISFTRPAS